ncbi:MAG: SDR family NAD(P)-dependent oxidoreductase [Nitrososphaeria archaeon]|nr:SDR family NAD(P)-dependent oxidoreductase [Nitrosopumilaceae archaeon]NDB87667.1 SDR family NAD(P)-dependent oxidoreductase [Nitrososphaerota archaeon]NDB91699.1 SDR family NAD(P)-dependent oxidoreductase [Nitrososphaeria archaeon]NDB89728.1 SDR family NAD(P)-dependent oxidoreductase [Nitrososphaerota archaeon]NDF26400.1 SDR family NAD(P)-dependent oxidoreductase [Nitrosopumilaceae archaeon]
MLKFQNKVVLVTGSGTGIGQTVAKLFAENGAGIIILGRRKEPLDDTKKILDEIINRVKSNAKVWLFPGVDVSDEVGVSQMYDSLQKEGVFVDVVVNNAGVSGPVTCFANSPLDEFKSAVGIHLTGTFWTSVQALKVMKPGAKIITISTFFTEEKSYEQRPYRFRSPYTAAQGAKNRLSEAMSWELVEKGIVSIATNPGPVHSDRIYKTVYPKAAAEFLRVSGFEDLTPAEVEIANKDIVGLLGEDEKTINEGIAKGANAVAKTNGGDVQKISHTLAKLLAKIQEIAEKVQKNTSFMIADKQFLSQIQVAQTVLTLADDDIAKTLNGKVIPGDRVFYPVKPHIATITPTIPPSFASEVVVFAIDATDKQDADRAEFLAQHVEKNGGKAVCFISNTTPKELQDSISSKFHSHVINFANIEEVQRWFNTAKTVGKLSTLVYITGKISINSKIIELSRKNWDSLVDKFVNTPATVIQTALETFVPGGKKDPRKYKDAKATVMIIGPDLPTGPKVSGADRARVEVFRGALRPFATTVNQELSDVLSSNVRSFLVLPGSIDGKDSDNAKIASALNYFVSDSSRRSSEVIFCVDETR